MVAINGIEFTEKQISEMSRAGLLNIGQKNDPSSSTPNAQFLHGVNPGNAAQYGTFSYPGVRPERFSAMTRPLSMARLLRPEKADVITEIIEIVTGQTAGTTSNASGWCADGALAGVLKTCQQMSVFGKFKMRSPITPVQEVGKLRTRADIPGSIINTPPRENPFIPDMMYRLSDDRSELQYMFYTLGNQMERSFEIEAFRGVAGQDNSIPGWWKDFDGLDRLIKTGYVDAVSGLACSAADSDVITWNADVGATVSGRNIVQAFTDLYWSRTIVAQQVGMGDTQWAFVMRMEQFRALVGQWVCQYYINRCVSSNAGQPFTTEVMETRRLFDEMMQGQYLLIDGVPVPVIFSEGINIEQLSGGAQRVLRADAYLVPVSWQGRPLLRLEYFDMSNPYATELINRIYTSGEFLNNGMYLLTKNERDGCIEFAISAQMRLILETPFLAGRIDDISFTYQANTRVADPGTTFLYVDGGVSYRTAINGW